MDSVLNPPHERVSVRPSAEGVQRSVSVESPAAHEPMTIVSTSVVPSHRELVTSACDSGGRVRPFRCVPSAINSATDTASLVVADISMLFPTHVMATVCDLIAGKEGASEDGTRSTQVPAIAGGCLWVVSCAIAEIASK